VASSFVLSLSLYSLLLETIAWFHAHPPHFLVAPSLFFHNMMLSVSDNMVLQWRRTKRAASAVVAFVFIQAVWRDIVLPVADELLTSPLRPTVAEISQAVARSCRRVPSPAGDLFPLDAFPSKENRASRSGSVGAELQICKGELDEPEVGAQGTPHPGIGDFIEFTFTNQAKLMAAMEELKAEHKSDMEEIKSEMEKIISGLRRHTGEFRELKDEVAHQGKIQRLVILSVLVSTMALGFFAWTNYDEWMNRLGALVKVWAGEALYEFTGGWFGKKVR
jgi:hypothetical protein